MRVLETTEHILELCRSLGQVGFRRRVRRLSCSLAYYGTSVWACPLRDELDIGLGWRTASNIQPKPNILGTGGVSS
jgi:hypothetical protein